VFKYSTIGLHGYKKVVSGLKTNYPKELSKDLLFDWLCRLGDQYQTGFVVSDPDQPNNPLIYVNDSFLRLTGFSRAEIVGENCRVLQGSETLADTVDSIRNQMATGDPIHTELLNYRKDGTPFWNELVIQPLRDDKGILLFYIGLQLDVTSRKQTESLFVVQQDIYQGIEKGYALSVLLQKICDVAESFFQQDTKCSILLLDSKEQLIVAAARSLPESYNQAIQGRKIGINAGSCGTAAFTKKPVIVTDIETSPLWTNYKDLAIANNLRACWSIPILTQENKVVGTIATYFTNPNKPRAVDLEFMQRLAPLISLVVKYSDHQEEILRLAYMDADTGIPNRHYFINELKDLLNENEPGFVAIIEPSEFAHIVDVYGRVAGDELIKQMCNRIQRVCKRSDDIIARFSSPALIISSLIPTTEIERYTSLIMSSVNDPFLIGNEEMYVTMKIGVTPFQGNKIDCEELIRYADTAISEAKKRAGSALSFFTIDQDEKAKRKLSIINHLSHALQRSEFDVHIQPKVDLNSGKIFSFEALARWNSPELGQVPPNVFIQAAENSGKIRAIEQIILAKVLTWLQKRKRAGKILFPVAINISNDHFFYPYFVADLRKTVKGYGIPAKYLRIEITESIGLVDFDLAKNIFGQLKLAGFESSVDDFGMGFSSLNYLQQLPVSEIKIDRSFISKIESEGTLAIVRTIVQLAANLNMKSIAEGIETVEQLSILRTIGCNSGQGYYFHKPMTFEQMDTILDMEQL
jgi:diguanylate cyclase (GGDEF)-like protein/PAS domain S-box-containing protein